MQKAFSLVELSIVLVILGLLVGGILAGQSLIRGAELRGVTAEYQRFVAASQTFRSKYNMLPGDISNATSFWGIAGGATGNDATCQTTVSTDAKTCNGNGDGRVYYSTGSIEPLRLWQHLANAGLLEGTYTGVDVATIYYSTGVNTPISKMNNNTWAPSWNTYYPGDTYYYPGERGNYLMAFAKGSNITVPNTGGFLPEEAWNIDMKLDDGKPGVGKVMVGKGNGTTICTSTAGVSPPGDNPAGSTYRLDLKSKDCILYFLHAF